MNCTVDECERPARGGGLCHAHQKRRQRNMSGPVGLPRGRYARSDPWERLTNAALIWAECDALNSAEYTRAKDRFRKAALAFGEVQALKKKIDELRAQLAELGRALGAKARER